MKTMIKTIVMCSALAATLSACSEAPKEKKQVVVSNKQTSDELTEAGEQLIAPYTLNLANRAFEMALEKNPNDKKAQFYNKFLKRYMVFRGSVANLKPMTEKYGNKEGYDNQVKSMPMTPMKKFLMTPENTGAYTKESDIQALLIQYRKALVEFRQFITENPDLNLELQMNPYVFQDQINNRIEQNCQIVETGEVSRVECDVDNAALVRVNVADLMVLKQEAAAEILYVTLYASYNIDGISQAMQDLKALEGKGLTAQQATEHVLKNVNLEVLDKEGLQSIKSITTDMLVAVKWVQKYSEKLCPKADGINTRKNYLIENGGVFCLPKTAEFEQSMAQAEQTINGAITVKLEDQSSTTVNALALFNNPVKSLKQLAPATWSADGMNATSLRDNTVGGILVNGDAQRFLKQSQQ